MDLDDEVCMCYHVTLRKLVNFAARTRPRVASQMADCLGAGTGCGWCRRILCEIAQAENPRDYRPRLKPAEARFLRREYHRQQGLDGAAAKPSDDASPRSQQDR